MTARGNGGKTGPGSGRLGVYVQIKCVREWHDWLDGMARSRGTTISGAVDEAVAMLADRVAYDPPPSRTGQPTAWTTEG